MRAYEKKQEKLVSKIMKKKTQKRTDRPRLYVFRSNRHIYAQVIDDNKSKTIAASSSLSSKFRQSKKSSATCAMAMLIGEDIANKLKNKGIDRIVFDRGARIYHGRIKALAEATRQAGIIF